MRRRRWLVALVAGLLVGACGGGDDSSSGDGAGDERPSREESPAALDPILAEAGITSVVLTGPDEDGAGKVPTFSWDAVDGATEYRLFVLSADGRPIWAWQGAETEAIIGGIPDRPDGEAGPIITDGSTWSVAALDADGAVIAISPERSVSP